MKPNIKNPLKSGFKTTEFYLTALLSTGGIYLQAKAGDIGGVYGVIGFLMTIVSVGLYLIQRYLLKIGELNSICRVDVSSNKLQINPNSGIKSDLILTSFEITLIKTLRDSTEKINKKTSTPNIVHKIKAHGVDFDGVAQTDSKLDRIFADLTPTESE